MLTSSLRKCGTAKTGLRAAFSFDGVAQNSYDRFRSTYIENYEKLQSSMYVSIIAEKMKEHSFNYSF